MQLRWIGPVERFAVHPSAPWLLAAIGFASSSFLPVAPEVLLVPMALMQPSQTWQLCTLSTVATTVGALLGYVIGAEFWEHFGQRLVEVYGWSQAFDGFRELFAKWGVWIIILKALTPIPFKFAAIAAGLAKMNLVTFTIASFVSRALHFLLMALFFVWLGPRVRDAIERYETRAAVVGGVVVAVTVIYVSLH